MVFASTNHARFSRLRKCRKPRKNGRDNPVSGRKLPIRLGEEPPYESESFDDPHPLAFLAQSPPQVDAAPAHAGRLLGLCVGVSKYADAALDLGYAAKDAEALAAQLSKQRGVYADASVAALVDEKDWHRPSARGWTRWWHRPRSRTPWSCF